ncbi:MAG: glutaredoxin family protein [Ekhidna sp.]
MRKDIILYGSKECHKTNYYRALLIERNLDYIFHDVIEDEQKAKELRSLYESGKLNFPTILVGDKKLRNPSDKDLNKWLDKICTSASRNT